MPVPITNNTGSLPDLTVLHFPPPLATPLDAEDQNYQQGTPANLSPTHAHQMGLVHSPGPGSPQAQSPAQRRRPMGGPSPLVLSSSPSQQMRMPSAHSPPVSVSMRVWHVYMQPLDGLTNARNIHSELLKIRWICRT